MAGVRPALTDNLDTLPVGESQVAAMLEKAQADHSPGGPTSPDVSASERRKKYHGRDELPEPKRARLSEEQEPEAAEAAAGEQVEEKKQGDLPAVPTAAELPVPPLEDAKQD